MWRYVLVLLFKLGVICYMLYVEEISSMLISHGMKRDRVTFFIDSQFWHIKHPTPRSEEFPNCLVLSIITILNISTVNMVKLSY